MKVFLNPFSTMFQKVKIIVKIIPIVLFLGICKGFSQASHCEMSFLQQVPRKNFFLLHQNHPSDMKHEEPVFMTPKKSNVRFIHGLFDKTKVLWDFSRPHTFIGTGLSIPAIHFFAVPNFWTLPYLCSILFCWIPSGFINIYITGLNQIVDTEIDSINKPFLPIPSGQLSKRTASFIVGFSLLCSIGFVFSPVFQQSIYGTVALQRMIVLSALFGTLYSIPPFRLKRFPILASFCILLVRGIILHFGFYQHALTVAVSCLYPKVVSTVDCGIMPWKYINFFQVRKCIMLTAFFTIFSFVIALMKDVPDVKGDARNSIKSFSVRKGPAFMFHFSNNLLSSLFVSTSVYLFYSLCSILQYENFLKNIVDAIINGNNFWEEKRFIQQISFFICKFVISISAFANGMILYRKGKKINIDDEKSTYNHYMFIWKLFYVSYLILPFLA
jgi:homogentisate phytyltransferase/homogentisate geranylgeranyltransferase